MLFTHTGLSPTLVWLSRHFCLLHECYWAGPISLATTFGVSVDFLSYGYWDVSIPRVCFLYLCIQYKIPLNDLLSFTNPEELINENKSKGGFPHSEIVGSKGIAPHRRLSQRITSFIASDCQGIHQLPFKTLEFKSRAGINPLHII